LCGSCAFSIQVRNLAFDPPYVAPSFREISALILPCIYLILLKRDFAAAWDSGLGAFGNAVVSLSPFTPMRRNSSG
jgi:hypothetical protein